MSSQCPQVGKEYTELRIPITTCGYVRRQSVVCCPNSQAVVPDVPVAIPVANSNLRISAKSESKIKLNLIDVCESLNITSMLINTKFK